MKPGYREDTVNDIDPASGGLLYLQTLHIFLWNISLLLILVATFCLLLAIDNIKTSNDINKCWLPY